MVKLSHIKHRVLILRSLGQKSYGSIWIILILISCLTESCNSFDSKLIDSQKTNKELSIDSLNKLAWDTLNQNISLFFELGQKAYKSSKDEDYLFGMCESSQIVGAYYYYTGVLDSAEIWYWIALDKRTEYGDSSLISGTLNNLGALCKMQGRFTQTIEYYLAAEEMIPSDNRGKKARINDNIGITYTQLGNYAEALKYNQKAADFFFNVIPETNAHVKNLLHKSNILESMSDFELADSLYKVVAEKSLSYGDSLSYANSINNLGNIYLKQNKLEQAQKYYEEALELYKRQGFLSEVAGTKENLGLLYKNKGDFDKAIEYFDDSIQRWKSLKNLQKQAEVLINLGDLYLIQDKLLKAENVFLESLSLSPLNLEVKSRLYNNLFLFYSKRGMLKKAIPFHMKYKTLIDSLSMERIKWRNLEAEFTRNQNGIIVLEKEKETTKERIEKERILRIFLISVILFVSIMTLLLFLNWRGKKKRLMAEKKALEKQSEIERLLKDQELISIRNILDMQDKERKRIAQDLHDRLGSMLSMVKLHFQKTNKGIEELKKLNQEEYIKANKLLDEACDEVRKIAHNLMSGVLKNFGLIAAMKELKTTLENTGQYKVELLNYGFEKRLPSEYETTIYRIIQELISNIIRHANASEISLQFFMKKDFLQIIIEDNGIGYHDDIDSKGMGLKNIKSRLLALNGTMVTDSHKSRGTSNIIEIPVNIKS